MPVAFLIYDHRDQSRLGKPQLSQAKFKIGGMSLFVGGVSCPDISPEIIADFVRRNFNRPCKPEECRIIDSAEAMCAEGWTAESYAYCFCGNRRAELPFKK